MNALVLELLRGALSFSIAPIALEAMAIVWGCLLALAAFGSYLAMR